MDAFWVYACCSDLVGSHRFSTRCKRGLRGGWQHRCRFRVVMEGTIHRAVYLELRLRRPAAPSLSVQIAALMCFVSVFKFAHRVHGRGTAARGWRRVISPPPCQHTITPSAVGSAARAISHLVLQRVAHHRHACTAFSSSAATATPSCGPVRLRSLGLSGCFKHYTLFLRRLCNGCAALVVAPSLVAIDCGLACRLRRIAPLVASWCFGALCSCVLLL